MFVYIYNCVCYEIISSHHFRKVKCPVEVSLKLNMGDTEDQEVQEGPVENAWALKVKNLLINYYLRYLKHNKSI